MRHRPTEHLGTVFRKTLPTLSSRCKSDLPRSPLCDDTDVLKSMTDSHRGRKAIRPKVEMESVQRGSVRQEARGNSKQSKSIQSPLDLDQLQMVFCVLSYGVFTPFLVRRSSCSIHFGVSWYCIGLKWSLCSDHSKGKGMRDN